MPCSTFRVQWTNVEQTNKGAIHEQKVKCAYLPPEDGTAANGIPEESEETVDQSRVDESVSWVLLSFHPRGTRFGQVGSEGAVNNIFPSSPFRDRSTVYQRNTRHDGLARWTTKPDKEYDSNLFRNGGYSYWEPAAETYSPKVCPRPPVSQAALCMTWTLFRFNDRFLANGLLTSRQSSQRHLRALLIRLTRTVPVDSRRQRLPQTASALHPSLRRLSPLRM